MELESGRKSTDDGLAKQAGDTESRSAEPIIVHNGEAYRLNATANSKNASKN